MVEHREQFLVISVYLTIWLSSAVSTTSFCLFFPWTCLLGNLNYDSYPLTVLRAGYGYIFGL